MTERGFGISQDGTEIYRVSRVRKPVVGTVQVPGSKSITNRALLLAAMSEGEVHLTGVLFSDDSRHFLDCLETLGYEIDISEEDREVTIKGEGGRIPRKAAQIDVGSAGTAARFLTAMLALSEGKYTIQCSEQMKKRPMKELFRVITELGAQVTYLESEGHLPVVVEGIYQGGCADKKIEITMDISKSTQYLSAMLMMAPLFPAGLRIRIVSAKKDGSYIRITKEMMRQFGVEITFDGECYTLPVDAKFRNNQYVIEPDVSAACYFYGAAAITGGSVTVQGIHKSSMQGDIRFLDVLKQIGCKVEDTLEGIRVNGPDGGNYRGIDFDMNDFSDQALTLAALAAFAETDTRIRNIGHIRGQECNRMQAIVKELGKCGLSCREELDDICIQAGRVHGAVIHTYEDHRVAMAFTLLGLRTEGIVIENPRCCGKTFENYYEVLEGLIR